jgi:hypothetical protein
MTGELDCVHLELRLLNANAIRRAGCLSPSDLFHLDPQRVFERYVKLTNLDPEKVRRQVEQVVRRAVSDDRKRYRGVRTNDFIDRYRASIPRRIRGLFHRLQIERAQTVKDFFPGLVARAEPIPVKVLNLPRRLTIIDARSALAP